MLVNKIKYGNKDKEALSKVIRYKINLGYAVTKIFFDRELQMYGVELEKPEGQQEIMLTIQANLIKHMGEISNSWLKSEIELSLKKIELALEDLKRYGEQPF